MDLYDAASVHSMVLATLGRRQKTLDQYLFYERKFLAYLEAKKIPRTLDALNVANVRQAIIWQQKNKRGSRDGEVGVATFGRIMRIWSTFLEREGVYKISPLIRMANMQVDDHEPVPYTKTEQAALLAATGMKGKRERPWYTRNLAIFYLFLDTGMRVGEIAALTLDRVLLRERRIVLEGKSRRGRSVPFGDLTTQDGGPGVRAVRDYLAERNALHEQRPLFADDQLLLNFTGRPLTVRGIEDVIKRLGRLAGVTNAIPHRFRHTYATWYLTVHTGDETGLQEILGHVDQKMMRHYVHLARVSVQRRAVQAMPSRFLKSG